MEIERINRKAASRLFALMAVGLLVLASGLQAQEVSASITGVITYPTGAAVVNASVNARDINRGTVWPTTTNEVGIYFFPRIPAGNYELRVEAPGFRTAVRTGIGLEVNQRARVNITLDLGQVAETVEVTGEAPLLQTDTTIVGTTITANRLVNTPILSRNFIALTLLTPGVTTTNPSGFNNDRRTTGGGRPYVNGNRKEANNFLLDGIDNNQVSDNLTSYQPNPDAISEVKVITNNASAEFGNFQGGIVSVNLKSGTNDFHGSLFHFFRNDKLNANEWARNWQGLERGFVRYNSFGGTIGGPVLIPGLFNGKDKLFFFADYMGMRRPTPATLGQPTVMTEAYRNGDFSALGRPVYNPFALDANGNRTPFANNQIPLSLRSPVASALFNARDLYPLPLTADNRFNQLNAASNQLNLNQSDYRVDAKPSMYDDISVRYSMSNQTNPGQNTFPLTFNSFNDSPFKAGVVNWTRAFSPTIVNEARMGVNRITLHNGGDPKGFGDLNQQLGIAGVNSPGLLAISFGNSFTSGIGNANIGTQQLFANTTYHFADNLTIIRGRHMMKMGGQVLRQQMNTFYAGNNGRTGFMQFNGRFTALNSGASVVGTGDADFFLGLPEVIGRGLDTGTWGHRKTIWGFYFQDDWRATDRLTLNLGLRWEYHTPLIEVADRQSNFEPFSGRLLLAGQDGNSRALYEPYRKDFQPRIGFAYTMGNFVARGAYTMSSFMEGTGTNLRLPFNPPFNAEFEGRYDSPAFNLPLSTASEGLTALRQVDPFARVNIRLWDPFVRPANTQQWNFTLERQLPGQMVATAGYVGQKGHHLVVPMPYFQRRLLPGGGVEASPYLRDNPQLANIAQISGTESNGNQQYHGLQATMRKRMTGGLEFQANYTFSKGMSDAIGYYGEGGQAGSQSAYWQYLYDRRAEWGPTYFDARHMFNITHVWELPFGKGKAMGSDMPGFAQAVLGNWQIGGILTLRGGFPLTMRAPDNSGTLSRGARADRIAAGGTLSEVGRGSRWFDTTAYRIPAGGTLGSAGNGTERGPGLKTYDVSVQKQFPIKERMYMELRGEAFNLTNTPIFNGPNRSANSPAFGEVAGAQGERQIQLALRFHF
ncbi:MAG: TonB-dependent receptor [Bryobacterales bacterium]|nr:TonB-dependent receptor [Bryobacterales bacterium]